MKKLRLLMTKDCNRNCEKCCNKVFDLDALPLEDNYGGYEEIILTGGEPMLYPTRLESAIRNIRRLADKDCKIYLHTAKINDMYSILCILDILDGITITIHKERDIEAFQALDKQLNTGWPRWKRKSLKLTIFKGIEEPIMYCPWYVKYIEWLEPKDCPLPEGEVFKRFKFK